jgi:hypothetical protein
MANDESRQGDFLIVGRIGQDGTRLNLHPLIAFMVAVSSPRSAPRRDWRHWLALGLCFGLGHGITQRVLDLSSADGPAGVQNFGVQAFPGQTLDAMRQRYGKPGLPVRADLDALQQERRSRLEQAEAERRRGELDDRQEQEDRQARQEAERARIEALDPKTTPALPALPPLNPEPPPAAAPEPPAPAAGPAMPVLPQAPPAPSPAAQP